MNEKHTAAIETPVRRTRTLKPDAYFNHKSNAAAIVGNHRKFQVFWDDKGLGICQTFLPITIPLYAALLFVLGPTLSGISESQGIGLALVLALLLFLTPQFVIAGRVAWRKFWVSQRAHKGHIVTGEIVRCVASSGSWFYPNFVVSIEYSVRTLRGKADRGILKETRNDLDGKQLPASGTPVYILYFNDGEYYLL